MESKSSEKKIKFSDDVVEYREEEDGIKDEDLKWGFFGFTPDCLQFLTKAGWFVFFMFWANSFQSMVSNGLLGVVITSIETRFQLTSQQSSWIAASYEIAAIPVLLVVSYVGSRLHRPFWTGMGELALAVGSIIFCLPHFLTDTYIVGGGLQEEYMCLTNTTGIDRCGQADSGQDLGLYISLFVLARVLHGMGAEPMYTLAVTYLDDCVTKEQFSFYIAIFYIGVIMGPALAYIVGGFLLTVYTDFYTVSSDELTIDSADPRWVGAWWLGFIVSAGVLFIVSIPFMGYPRDLPGAAAIRAAKKSEAYNASTEQAAAHEEVGLALSDIPRYTRDLITNPSWVCMSFFSMCDLLLISGFTVYGPKYVESQFSASPAVAGMAFGIIVIPGGAGGLLVGGSLIKRWDLPVRSIMKWEAIFTLTTVVAAAMFFVNCDPIAFAGLNQPYPDNISLSDNFTAGCNVACGCEDVAFMPVCGADGVQYFSPCHAGCQDVLQSGETMEYWNCSCLALVPGLDPSEPDATSRSCADSICTMLPVFMVFFFIGMFLLFVCQSMTVSCSIRCIPTTHRTLAIGFQTIIARLLGGLTGPVFFAMAFDNSCDLWDDHCGQRGACLAYNPGDMATNMATMAIVVKVISLILMIIAWKTYKPPQDEEEMVQNEIKVNLEKEKTTQNGNVGVQNDGFTSIPETLDGQLENVTRF